MQRAGKRVKFLYTIPNFHNPAGVTQTVERRREILAGRRDHDVLIIEDNPYGLLGFDAEPLPALRSMTDDHVVYLGSFSKTFAPGFRIGWVLAPHAVREKLVLAQESATLCPPVFSQFAVAAYLHDHDWRGQIKIFREMYRERRDAMITGLRAHMPAGTTLDRAGRRLLRLGQRCRRVSTPTPCCRGRSPPGSRTCREPPSTPTVSAVGYMRLSYCFPTPERIIEGTRRLGEVLQYEAGVLATFGTATDAEPRALRPYEAPGANQT